MSSADDISAEISKQVHEQLDQTINVPDALSENEAVAFVIDAYRKETCLELPEVDVRTEVREQMQGRSST